MQNVAEQFLKMLEEYEKNKEEMDREIDSIDLGNLAYADLSEKQMEALRQQSILVNNLEQ